MVVPQSLGAKVPWRELLDVLGVTTSGRSLPLRGTCPACGDDRFDVCEDSIKGGVWHYCQDCKLHGDGIQVASAVWGMPPVEALEKMERLGVPLGMDLQGKTEKYAKYHTNVQDRCDRLWADSADFLRTNRRSATIAGLKTKLRIENAIQDAQWEAGPGLICRGSTVEMVRAANISSSVNSLSDRHHRNFKGRGWGDVLLLPWHDVPGRICGLTVVGRGGTREDTFRVNVSRSHDDHKGGLQRHEAGLYGLELLPKKEESDGVVVAVGDPFLALRIQVRNARLSARPLPVVAWHDGPSAVTGRAVWERTGGLRHIFWAWQLDYKTILQAAKADGRIALSGPVEPTVKSIDHYICLCSPADLIRKVRRQSRPWQDALGQEILEKPDGWCESILQRLRREGLDVAAVIRQFDKAARDRAESLLGVSVPRRTALFGGEPIFETGHHWQRWDKMTARYVVISNVVVKVDYIVTENGNNYYGGRLITKNGECPWELSAKGATETPVQHLQAVMHRHKLGILEVRATWGKRLVRIGVAFDQPTYLDKRPSKAAAPS